MENSTQIAVLNTLENEGKELAAEYKTRTAKADRIMFNFKNDTAANGFDTRLGKLMLKPTVGRWDADFIRQTS